MEMSHALSQVLPKGTGGPPPPLGCAVWLPREGEGKTRSHKPSPGATSMVNQFTRDVYLAGSPWGPSLATQGQRII